jgi:carbonic anhydrase
MKVILANTPDNLKDLLKSKLSNNSPLVGKEYSSASGLNAIKDSVDESGIIHIDVVAEKLRKNSIEIDVEQFMEHIETQGLVIRIESGIWKFLE